MVTLRVTLWQLVVAKYKAQPLGMPAGHFWSLTRTPSEWSLVCESALVPPNAHEIHDGWRCLEVMGPLDFALTGILSSIANPLAEAKISLFAVSTFDTDYILVKSDMLERAVAVLQEAGFAFAN